MKETVTFRLENEKRAALDALAGGLDRDRSYLLNEAVDVLLETYRWQTQHIQQGLREADAGKFASAAEVTSAFRRLRKRK